MILYASKWSIERLGQGGHTDLRSWPQLSAEHLKGGLPAMYQSMPWSDGCTRASLHKAPAKAALCRIIIVDICWLKDMRSQQQWQHSHPPQLQSVDKVGPGADFAMPPLKCHRSRDGLTSAPIANASYTCINLGSCGKWIVSNAMNVFGDADSKQILEEWGSPWRMSTLLACKAILFMKDQTRKFRNRSCSGIT